MKTIQTREDLIKWAREVNCGLGMAKKADYQDIYAHSFEEDIERFFLDSASDRALILCSVYNTMSYDTVEKLLKCLVRAKVQKQMKDEYEELDKRESALAKRESSFKESMKPFHQKMTKLRKRNEFLECAFSDLQSREAFLVEDNRALKREVNDLEAKASKYDTLRELLQLDGK